MPLFQRFLPTTARAGPVTDLARLRGELGVASPPGGEDGVGGLGGLGLEAVVNVGLEGQLDHVAVGVAEIGGLDEAVLGGAANLDAAGRGGGCGARDLPGVGLQG